MTDSLICGRALSKAIEDVRRLFFPVGRAGPHFPLNEIGNPVLSVETGNVPVVIHACRLDNDDVSQLLDVQHIGNRGKTGMKQCRPPILGVNRMPYCVGFGGLQRFAHKPRALTLPEVWQRIVAQRVRKGFLVEPSHAVLSFIGYRLYGELIHLPSSLEIKYPLTMVVLTVRAGGFGGSM